MASPPGHAARGIVRVSGDETFPLLSPHLEEASGVMSRVRLAGLELPVVALRFEGPRSYTGQDSIELQMPGNPVLLGRVVETLIGSGRDRGLDVRRAEAGEFTARAFLNDRLSLTEAEGVAATIAATSDAELAAARMLASNRLGERAAAWADDLAAALALVEAGIDFTDQEDVVAIAPDDLRTRLASLREQVGRHLDRGVGFEQLHALPWVVLAGPPNAGKSTLFNALLGHERAVVSELAGTTRDVLAEPLAVPTAHGDAEVMLVDVAGHEEDPTAVGRRMQTAASEARKRAELTLWCSPADDPCAGPADAVVLCTKADLGAAAGLAVSAATGAGLDDVRAIIAERLASRAVSLSGDAVALLARHESALRAAAECLDEALRLVDDAAGDELVAASMRAALDAIGALAGHVSPDDVLGRIFASFCVGK